MTSRRRARDIERATARLSASIDRLELLAAETEDAEPVTVNIVEPPRPLPIHLPAPFYFTLRHEQDDAQVRALNHAFRSRLLELRSDDIHSASIGIPVASIVSDTEKQRRVSYSRLLHDASDRNAYAVPAAPQRKLMLKRAYVEHGRRHEYFMTITIKGSQASRLYFA